jgi:hypothetical protein
MVGCSGCKSHWINWLMAKKKRPLTQAEQSARFIEAAKKAEADESGKKFDEAFSKIARAKPSGRDSSKSR